MSILNNPNCEEQKGNVGVPSCAIGITYPIGFIITEDSFKLTVANMVDWNTTLGVLSSACLAAVGSRIYPIFNVIGLTDNTPAPEAKTSGYGVITKHVEKPHSFELDTRDLGGKYFAELRKFKNRKDLRVYWIDASGFIGGEENSDGELLGFKCTFQPKQIKVGNVADITKYMVQLDITDPTALTDKLSAIQYDDSVNLETELNGILNVELVNVGTPAPGEVNVSVVSSISRINLFDEYSTLLADVDAWDVVRDDGYLDALISAVVNPATKTITLSLDGGAPPIGQSFVISLATPAELAALGIGGNGTSGFESDSFAYSL